MKAIIILTGLFFCISSYGQLDSLLVDSICIERGHVISGIFSETLMYCPPYIIDTDSITIQVYPSCNWRTYKCARCKKQITEREPERRIVIWRKE